MNLPFLFLAIANIVMLVSLVAGFVLLGVAVAGRRVGIDIRCRRCRHEFPRGGVIPEICTDCGADLTKPTALILGRYKLRGVMLAVALALIVAVPGAAGLVMFGAAFSARGAMIASGSPDALIDAAAQGDLVAASALSQQLAQPASGAAWIAVTTRLESDPAARPAILRAVVDHVRFGSMMPGGATAPDPVLLRDFGLALARTLESDPDCAEHFGMHMMNERLPPEVQEPVLASPAAVRAFLRGPTLRLRVLEAKDGGARGRSASVRPMLVYDAFSFFGRELAIAEAKASYLRTDGSVVELAPSRMQRGFELDTDFGTDIPVAAAMADPLWSGEIRLEATVGTVAASRSGVSARGESREVSEPFPYAWTIRVERVRPEDLRMVAVNDAEVVAMIRNDLGDSGVRVDGTGAARVVTLEGAAWGTVNGVEVRMRWELVQGERRWPQDERGGDRGEPSFAAPEFDANAPFRIVAQGVAPEPGANGPNDLAYLAGKWIVDFERTARPPRAIEHVPAEGAAASAPPELVDSDRAAGEVVRE